MEEHPSCLPMDCPLIKTMSGLLYGCARRAGQRNGTTLKERCEGFLFSAGPDYYVLTVFGNLSFQSGSVKIKDAE